VSNTRVPHHLSDSVFRRALHAVAIFAARCARPCQYVREHGMAGFLKDAGASQNQPKMSDKEKEMPHDEEQVIHEAEHTEGQEQATSEPTTEAKDPMTELQAKYDELNDKYLRLYSDFDNFRRRTAKERIDLLKSGGEDIFKLMLPVLDDFERAMRNMDTAQDVPSVKQGVELIYHKMTRELTAKGLKAMETKGQTFDPDFHEALTQIPAPSDDMKNKVIDEMEKGYFLNDKVIRFAKVVVGS
jgi:molecular chaperone GrpE